MIAPVFSFLLVSFVALWAMYYLKGSDLGCLIAIILIIIYLIYDIWYRLITKKKPQHHPERWPIGLIL